jgi:dipeptidyl-peptidase-4
MHHIPASRFFLFFCCLLFSFTAIAQELQWTPDGNSYWVSDKEGIAQVNFATRQKTVLVATSRLIPAGAAKPLSVRSFKPSADGKKILIFTNTQRVWRYDTRGDYWVYDLGPGTLRQLGSGLPAASLMFAKISPDGLSAAYVSQHNIYVENLASGKITRLTSDGTDKIINGTFDWAYEEEFDCRDGFRWSPDSKSIAYWQIDARDVKYFLMINNTDSIYSRTIPVEYPKVGENPSACRIGVVNLKNKKTTWMKVPGDPVQHYIPRMGWAPGTTGIVLQQLDRKQQESKIFLCEAATGAATQIYAEKDEAWTDVQDVWGNEGGLKWISQGNEFIWASEKNGWRSYYRVSRDGQREVNITPGDYDVISPVLLDEAHNAFYFMASPDNATERYLYRTSLDGTGKAVRLTPWTSREITAIRSHPMVCGRFTVFPMPVSPRFASVFRFLDHRSLDVEESVAAKWAKHDPGKNKVEFFQVTTSEGVTMDGWMVKPANLDTTKKYPVVFYVYSEPAGATVRNAWGTGSNWLYDGDPAADGYCYISLDNRGTPAPKGRAWRKAIYRKIGIVNIRDQALGAQALLKRWSWLDEKGLPCTAGVAAAVPRSTCSFNTLKRTRRVFQWQPWPISFVTTIFIRSGTWACRRRTGRISLQARLLPTPKISKAICCTSTAPATTMCIFRMPNCW